MKTFAAVLGYILIAIATPIWLGFVLSVMWGWFVVPLFHAPALSIASAIGISLVMGIFTTDRPDKDADEKKVNAIGFAVVFPALTLLMGFVVHLFV